MSPLTAAWVVERVASVHEGDRDVRSPQPHEPGDDAQRQDGGGQVEGHVGDQLDPAISAEPLGHQVRAPAGAAARSKRLTPAALPTLKLCRSFAMPVPLYPRVASRTCSEALTAWSP